MQNETTPPPSYFFTIARPSSIHEITRIYNEIKHLEPSLEEIHNYLPYPGYFDEMVELHINSYNTIQFISERLKIIEEIVLIVLSNLNSESVEEQNLFLDGFFTLHVFDKFHCERCIKFVKELITSIPYVKEFSLEELRDIFKIAYYHSYYPEDKIRTFETYYFANKKLKYMFRADDLFLHLFIDKINPVLLTDQFFILQTAKDYEGLHLILNGQRVFDSPTLKLSLNEQEYALLCSENHPPLKIRPSYGYGIEEAVQLVKSLLYIHLPTPLIYRLYFDKDFSINYLKNKNLNQLINEYCAFIQREPTIHELKTYLVFHNNHNQIHTNYPIFTKSEVRYLFQKEMSLYFKDTLSVFSECCDFCKSLSGAPIVHIEWMEADSSKHYTNYCTVCLEAKNMDYMMKYDPPF